MTMARTSVHQLTHNRFMSESTRPCVPYGGGRYSGQSENRKSKYTTRVASLDRCDKCERWKQSEAKRERTNEVCECIPCLRERVLRVYKHGLGCPHVHHCMSRSATACAATANGTATAAVTADRRHRSLRRQQRRQREMGHSGRRRLMRQGHGVWTCESRSGGGGKCHGQTEMIGDELTQDG